MLTRLIPVARALSQPARFQAVRCVADHAPAHFKSDIQIDTENKTTMAFHPVPEGDWQENHSKRNSKWNMMVAATSAFLVGTVFVMYKTDCLYLHPAPPKN